MKVGAYVTVGSGSGTVEAARDDCGDCDINEGNRSHDGYGDAGTARVGAGSSSLAEVMAIGSAASTGADNEPENTAKTYASCGP